mmetsp:Transcript_25278/g.37163  ORF Transcript_25278/g.37163 Transcript_25278/m.37163 type:complete len:301 (-) Transcript_25278:239-1141(-)
MLPSSPTDLHLREPVVVAVRSLYPTHLLRPLLLAVCRQIARMPAASRSQGFEAPPRLVRAVSRRANGVVSVEEEEVAAIEAILRAHIKELAHMHAYYAVSSISGEHQILREREAERQRDKEPVGAEGAYHVRLSMQQYSRLVRDCSIVSSKESLATVDSIFHATLRMASKQESNADMADTNGIRSKMNSNGSVRIAADNTGCGANSHNRGAESSSSNICHHFTTAWDDTAVSMGLLSFLASIVLIAANCPQRPPPSAGEVGWDMDGGRRRKQASSLSRAVSDIVVEKLLPRTCTLEYFWR